jgi:hypothetical protein
MGFFKKGTENISLNSEKKEKEAAVKKEIKNILTKLLALKAVQDSIIAQATEENDDEISIAKKNSERLTLLIERATLLDNPIVQYNANKFLGESESTTKHIQEELDDAIMQIIQKTQDGVLTPEQQLNVTNLRHKKTGVFIAEDNELGMEDEITFLKKSIEKAGF